MSIRPISFLSNIRSFRNSTLKFVPPFEPKCPPDDPDCCKKEKPKKLYEEGPMTPLKQKQIHFQKDDGLPIHLKAGLPDQILTNLTFAMCGVGLILTGMLFRSLIVGQNKKE